MKQRPMVSADGDTAGGLGLSLLRERDRGGRTRSDGVSHGGQEQPEGSVHIHR